MLKTGHSQDAVYRYIKHYEQVKKLIPNGMDETALKEITYKSMKVFKEYIKLYKDLNLRADKKKSKLTGDKCRQNK